VGVRTAMRVIFLTHHFPPDVSAGASRTFEHCREWQNRGAEITVVTSAPNHPDGKLRDGYRNRLWQREVYQGIQIIRLWTFLAANRGLVKRSISFLSYFVSAIIAIPFLPKADVVVSTSPQFFCGLAGFFVARAKRARWVLEIRDLWPDSISAVGALHNRLALRVLEALEGWAYGTADLVVPVTTSMARHIEGRGVPCDRIQVVANGVDLTRFRAPTPDRALARSLDLQDKFVAGYLGTHGMAHPLETVLEAASRLRHDPRVAFLLVGEGATREKLLGERDRLGLSNVVMLGLQPRDRMTALWSLCDVALVPLRRSPVLDTALPSKMLEAMAMGRPLIVAAEGEARALAEAAGAGLVVAPEDPQSLAEAVVRLAGDPALARELGKRGRAWVEMNHDRHRLARTLLRAIERICPPEPAASAALGHAQAHQGLWRRPTGWFSRRADTL
jgi:glycosyltransferase involved in cell wall biosynthesis